MVPSVPVPLLSRQCAAVTTASVSWSAMSPVTSRRVVFPIFVCIGIAETLLAELVISLTAGQHCPAPVSIARPRSAKHGQPRPFLGRVGRTVALPLFADSAGPRSSSTEAPCPLFFSTSARCGGRGRPEVPRPAPHSPGAHLERHFMREGGWRKTKTHPPTPSAY